MTRFLYTNTTWGWIGNNYCAILRYSCTLLNDSTHACMYGTAQRQLRYPHACCRLNILRWRLYHAFNIWMGTRYICARISRIIWRVHLQMLRSFWINILVKPTIWIVYTRWTYEYCLCMFQLSLESIVLLKSCSSAVSRALLFGWMWRMDLV